MKNPVPLFGFKALVASVKAECNKEDALTSRSPKLAGPFWAISNAGDSCRSLSLGERV